MRKLAEAISATVKLATTLIHLAPLVAVLGGGLWAYRTVCDITSRPIRLPSVELSDVKVPKIEIAAPDIKLPSISLPSISFEKPKRYDPATGWEIPEGGDGPDWVEE